MSAGANAATEIAEQAVTSEAKKEIAEDAIKQVAKSEAKLAGGIAKSADDGIEGGMAMAKTEQAIAKVEGEVAETAAETSVEKAVKTLQRQEMGVNLGIGAANTVGAGMIQGEGTEDMAFGVLRGVFGSLLPVSMNAKIDKLVGQGKMGSALKYGMSVLSDVTVGGNDLKFAVAGAHGNHLQAKKARKSAGGGGDDHVMSHHAEEPTYRPGVDDDGPIVTKPVADVDPHVLANGHNAEPDHLVTTAVDGPTRPTQAGSSETGSSNPFNQPTKDPAAHRVAENSPQQIEQAAKARAKLSAEDQGRHAAISAELDTPAKQVLVERALASGRSMDDVERLHHAMKGMSEEQILREFSGDGIAQFYGHSCVPTAYQIALAERDPVYALHLKNHPEEMRQGQENPLVITGGQLTQRNDMHDPPQALREQLDPQTKESFKASFDSQREVGGTGTVGIEPTLMKDQQLHKELEKATGTKYEVITNAAEPHEHKGQGEYEAIPFDRINAAADANQPVLFSQFGHEQVIVGRRPGPDGRMMYVVTDPSGARTTLVDPSQFDALPMISITLPVNADAEIPMAKAPSGDGPTGRTRAGGIDADGHSSDTDSTAGATTKDAANDADAGKNAYRSVEITDAKGAPIGELDGVVFNNSPDDHFVEDKNAAGLQHPKNRQTPEDWAKKQILRKTNDRIQNLANAHASRANPDGNGSPDVPTLKDLQTIKQFKFRINADFPELRAGVDAVVEELRAKHPDYTFEVTYGA